VKVNAYILAADPTWLERSVGAYYGSVGKIVVSYDRSFRGWTGSRIPVEECLSRLAAIDKAKKMIFVPGDFSRPVSDPMENDTLQRASALTRASEGADWVLQVDTDEWIPDVSALLRVLGEERNIASTNGIEWPMRVLYRDLGGNRALEVCAPDGGDHFEYIAPIAVRAGAVPHHSRRVKGNFLRAVVRGDRSSIQLKRNPESMEVRRECLDPREVIIHNSWARSPQKLRRKLASWSHSSPRAWWYYFTSWLPAKARWRRMRNLHPYFAEVWPALRITELPFPVRDPDRDHPNNQGRTRR
jgi:hypothetical protein